MRTHSETVSFRADEELLKLIDAECEEFKVSRGLWVRGVIISYFVRREAAITQDDLSDLLKRVDELTSTVNAIRPDVERSLYFVLTRVGKMPSATAKELVRVKFLDKRK